MGVGWMSFWVTCFIPGFSFSQCETSNYTSKTRWVAEIYRSQTSLNTAENKKGRDTYGPAAEVFPLSSNWCKAVCLQAVTCSSLAVVAENLRRLKETGDLQYLCSSNYYTFTHPAVSPVLHTSASSFIRFPRASPTKTKCSHAADVYASNWNWEWSGRNGGFNVWKQKSGRQKHSCWGLTRPSSAQCSGAAVQLCSCAAVCVCDFQ